MPRRTEYCPTAHCDVWYIPEGRRLRDDPHMIPRYAGLLAPIMELV